MRLLSINVGTPQALNHNGKTVQSSIVKTPITGSALLGYDNIVGNNQADLIHHGGPDRAVYAYGLNHYAHWQQWLGASNRLTYGSLGENLSFSNLNESTLCIGDELTIGEAVLAVSQFRVPCFKLGAKFERQDMPAAFTQYAHTGAYFKVLKAGPLEAGSAITVSHKNSNGVALKSLFEAWFKPKTHANNALLKRALKVDHLSSEWRAKIASRLANVQK